MGHSVYIFSVQYDEKCDHVSAERYNHVVIIFKRIDGKCVCVCFGAAHTVGLWFFVGAMQPVLRELRRTNQVDMHPLAAVIAVSADEKREGRLTGSDCWQSGPLRDRRRQATHVR